jgi:UDP-N-acetylmuramoyl-L-alanyl-D-glutamate--2,6-diaminopimelate ligase
VHLLQKKKIITFGMKGADVTKDNIKDFKSHLIGEYNAYNILAAAAVAKHLGVPAEVVKAAVGSFRLPKGRTEVVYSDGFTVMIDFAHTPNAFENLLSTLKKSRNKGRLIHVFGAAGQRDGAKRPVMGEIASRYDDVIVLTAEDPRGESVMKISQEIEKGIIRLRDFPEVTMIEDRQKAIEFAVSLAAKDDIVVITGKGHEESMNLGRGEVVWSDHEAVSSALVKRYEK